MSKFKSLCASAGFLLCSFVQINAAMAANTEDTLGLAGTYHCHGYDSHEGPYKGAVVTLKLDAKNSKLEQDRGAYLFTLVEPDGTRYIGEAAAEKDYLAVYFQNTSSSMKTDRGVGIAKVTREKNAQGKIKTVFNKFYYEPHYEGGGNGTETCEKVE